MIAFWMLLAAVAVAIDRGSDPWHRAVKHELTTVVAPSSTSTLLETITPGLLTVVSIIFFVLLMGRQHQSSTYTPVVLDQFLRRTGNQLFFGGFVGLTMYCLLALALVPPGKASTSAVVALVLSVITFGLLLFVYNTIDQMRPSSMMRMIQRLALRARSKQHSFLGRCRTRPQLPDAPSTRVTSGREGYVVDIDGRVLAIRLAPEQASTVEVEMLIVVGEHLVPGSVLAEVRGERADQRQRVADAVLDAITLGRMRDIDNDAGHAIDNLGSMAWSATAAAGDPAGARLAVETLHTLLRTRDPLPGGVGEVSSGCVQRRHRRQNS